MAFEDLAQGRAHRDHSFAASRFWGSKPLPVGIGLGNLDTPTQEVQAVPPKCENLSDPQTGEDCCQYDRAARFWQPWEQLLHLLRVRHPAPFLRLTPADLNAVSAIVLKIPGLDGGVKHPCNRDPNAV